MTYFFCGLARSFPQRSCQCCQQTKWVLMICLSIAKKRVSVCKSHFELYVGCAALAVTTVLLIITNRKEIQTLHGLIMFSLSRRLEWSAFIFLVLSPNGWRYWLKTLWLLSYIHFGCCVKCLTQGQVRSCHQDRSADLPSKTFATTPWLQLRLDQYEISMMRWGHQYVWNVYLGIFVSVA